MNRFLSIGLSVQMTMMGGWLPWHLGGLPMAAIGFLGLVMATSPPRRTWQLAIIWPKADSIDRLLAKVWLLLELSARELSKGN